MKFLHTLTIFIITPVIFCVFLLSVLVPLVFQHFFKSKEKDNNREYPYLTSWEEAA